MNTANINKERMHALVTGRVQGVGFRYYVRQHALSLSLSGLVRNLAEGQVEVIAEGPPEDLDRLLDLITIGPSGALVIDVRQSRSAGTGEFLGFHVDTSDYY